MLTVPELVTMVAEGRIQLVDLAAPPRFAQSHPAGARNIPFGPSFSAIAAGDLVRDVPVALFAEHGAVAERAADDLRRAGLEVVAVVSGGIEGWKAKGGQAEGVQQMSVDELAAVLAEGKDMAVLDVREPYEWRSGVIDGAVLMSLGSVPERHQELDRGRPLAVLCAHGSRSAQATAWLQTQGFHQVYNVPGGMALWLNQGHPTTSPPA